MADRALLVCVSVSHGNTAAVARAMAEVLDADVREPEEVDPSTLSGYDIVGFGSGIFYGSHHPRLRRFVDRLPRAGGTHAFVFSTGGAARLQSRPWQSTLESVLTGKGYDVVGSFACAGYDTWLPLRLIGGSKKGHPDAADLSRAHEFAEHLARRLPAR